MKHVHADLIKQWVDDTSIEVQMEHDGVWYTVEPPMWHPECKYRIKPKMIKVGRHSWPEPLKEVPTENRFVYSFYFEVENIREITSRPGITTAIQNGIAHATKAAAKQHRDALICISTGDIE